MLSVTSATASPSIPPAPVDAHQPEVRVRAFRAADHAEVTEMFVAGMMLYSHVDGQCVKFWSDYVENSLRSDIADIEGTYFASGGHFWVATMMEHGEEVVVGMVGLEGGKRRQSGSDERCDCRGYGELRRMSVKAEYRRFGVGRALIVHLEQWARAHRFHTVWLSAGVVQVQAHRFYHSLGYELAEIEVFCREPYFERGIFVKALQ